MTTERWIDVPGGRLFSVADGEGRPIVLLHAGIADLRAWDPMIDGLVAAGLRAIRYDTRAYGRSTTEDVAFSNRADVIAVLDAWGVGRAALVGNSRGGQIAFDTAIEFPDRVVAVIGVGSGLGGFEGSATPEEEALFEEGDRLETADPRDPDAIADFDVRLWVDGPGQSPTRVPAAIREAVRMMDRPLYLAEPGRGPADRARAARGRARRRPALPGPRRRRRAGRVRRGRDGSSPRGRGTERPGRGRCPMSRT